ncbi:MAG: nicotinate-nucleotide--dimethylbenzimidazole phosphoribosyltransferase [Eubacteriaceae bacterium]|jgi:nicotinate-nucleotide--dimethylbenzimidazole phosphoribosyltransferase|nr:nicotinate-nucleotide--dimethylbenzimidazole phosphoribosyltransferase [Eubacteriaceae bacterium]
MKTLEEILNGIEPKDAHWEAKATEKLKGLAIPTWSLGKILDVAQQISAIERTDSPEVTNKMIFTMAADHGVADEGVSAFPQIVTLEMIDNIVRGGAGVNVLTKAAGGTVCLVDMGVKKDLNELVDSGQVVDCKIAYGSENMRKGPAMTREQAVEALERSFAVVSDAIEKYDLKLVGTGELGIGNTTPSSAVVAVLGGYPVTAVTGKGTGLNNTQLLNKAEVIKDSIALNNPDPEDAIDVLSKIGGYDIAGIAGTVLAAAYHRIPVVVDGFISTAGAMIAKKLKPETLDYMIASHRSEEPGHQYMWEALGLEPLLQLNLCLGEGTGAAVAFHICECACRCINDMLSFEDAGVTDGNA